jgi:cation transport protein ChaC
MSPQSTLPHARDPAAALERTLSEWGQQGDMWVFGYASLIWRPAFTHVEHRPAFVPGWHRALQMRSRINRGTPQRPGLVFALLRGGSCRGMVYRIARHRVPDELVALWEREMPTATYDARWLACRTPAGAVRALGFTLPRDSPAHCGALGDEEMLHILRHSRGRYGSTLEYLLETARGLRGCGIHDRKVERLVGLAQRHGLAAPE